MNQSTNERAQYRVPPTAALNEANKHASSKPLLVVFWAYVTIPLAWGVINTLLQASKLFH